jgi:ribonucleoside-triphosphate reductase
MTEKFIGQKCEIFSRVVGYIRPIQQWNEGKVAEFEQRKNFKIKKIC